MRQRYSIDELMVTAVAQLLEDNELGFVGLGTAERAFVLAVGIPIAAARLAQQTHAPHFSIYWANLLSPSLDRIPSVHRQDHYTCWPAAASLFDIGYKVDMLTRGDFDVSFNSAAQVDRFGNLNITQIGKHKAPKVRLVGCLAQPEHLSFVRKPIIISDLNRRTFVDKVDYMTSVGYYHGANTRADLGLSGPGPYAVVTDKAVLDFEASSKQMRLVSIHPHTSLEEVLDNMAFKPIIPENQKITKEPTTEQIELIRHEIDPNRVLLQT